MWHANTSSPKVSQIQAVDLRNYEVTEIKEFHNNSRIVNALPLLTALLSLVQNSGLLHITLRLIAKPISVLSFVQNCGLLYITLCLIA